MGFSLQSLRHYSVLHLFLLLIPTHYVLVTLLSGLSLIRPLVPLLEFIWSFDNINFIHNYTLIGGPLLSTAIVTTCFTTLLVGIYRLVSLKQNDQFARRLFKAQVWFFLIFGILGLYLAPVIWLVPLLITGLPFIALEFSR